MKIFITATPGVGKTTLSKTISETLGIKHIDLSKFIKENQLYDSYDKEFDTHIFNEKTVKKELKKYLNDINSFIIDTHSPECVSFIDFDQIYILKVENSVLFSRLKERGYTDKKIKENINCEIFGITEETVEDLFGEGYDLVGEIEGCISEKKIMEKIKKGNESVFES